MIISKSMMQVDSAVTETAWVCRSCRFCRYCGGIPVCDSTWEADGAVSPSAFMRFSSFLHKPQLFLSALGSTCAGKYSTAIPPSHAAQQLEHPAFFSVDDLRVSVRAKLPRYGHTYAIPLFWFCKLDLTLHVTLCHLLGTTTFWDESEDPGTFLSVRYLTVDIVWSCLVCVIWSAL